MSSSRISYKGKAKIVNEEYVLKEKNKNIKYLYDYLSSRDFYNYSELIDEEENYNKFKYIKTTKSSNVNDVLSLIGDLHSKTISDKDINEENVRKIYNNILENIKYLENYYINLITNIESKEFFSPSEFLLARNISVIFSSLNFSKENLNKWKDYISKSYKTRVSIVHNNLSNNHVIDNNLISFDNYIKDSPIIDIYKYYINQNSDVSILKNLDIYEEKNKLNYEENLILNVLFALPTKIKFSNDELNNTIVIRKVINTLFEVEKIIKNRDVNEPK